MDRLDDLMELYNTNIDMSHHECFRNNHSEDMLPNSYGITKGETAGWYINDQFKMPFRKKPSFFARQKMYWGFGWSWKDNPDFKND